MIERIKSYVKTNDFKQDLLFIGFTLFLTLSIFLFMTTLVFSAISKDLANQLATVSAESEGYLTDRNVCLSEKDSIIQSYEEVIPKQQYIQDVEYLESVILELRKQLEEK